MRSVKRWLLGLLLAAIGCGQPTDIDRFIPQEEAELAKTFLGQLAAGDFGALKPSLDSALLGEGTQAELQQLADQFPEGSPISVEAVGVITYQIPPRVRYDLTFQYQYPEQWLLANVVLVRENGEVRVAGIHVRPLTASLQELNRFTFAGKGALHYIVFALALAIPFFIVVVLVVCARTTMPRRKWLWYLFIVLGFVQFKLNWTDGAWNVSPIGFQLLGAGFARMGPAAPYVLTIAIPLGAMLFLWKRSSLVSRPKTTAEPPAPTEGTPGPGTEPGAQAFPDQT